MNYIRLGDRVRSLDFVIILGFLVELVVLVEAELVVLDVARLISCMAPVSPSVERILGHVLIHRGEHVRGNVSAELTAAQVPLIYTV